MGYFDFLVEPGAAPVKGMSYILLSFLIPDQTTLRFPKALEEDGEIIVTGVEQIMANGKHVGYDFSHAGTNYHTKYNWILAENTPDNRERVKALRDAQKALEKAKEDFEQTRIKVKTLKP